ncbi:MAG: Fur family transcriptional regulator [Methyloligellaceae bacterium]
MTAVPGGQADLTKNQRAVFSALLDAEKPLGAYEILDEVRDQGFRAPLQVYRALQKLMELRLVHRIESRNAFVACDHEPHTEAVCFLICDRCEKAIELPIHDLEDGLQARARGAGFTISGVCVEITGTCKGCGS